MQLIVVVRLCTTCRWPILKIREVQDSASRRVVAELSNGAPPLPMVADLVQTVRPTIMDLMAAPLAIARVLMMAAAQQKSPGAILATLTAERNALAVTEGCPEGVP